IPRPLLRCNNRRQRRRTLSKSPRQRRKRKVFGAVCLAVLTTRKIIKEPSPRPPRPRETAGRTKEALHGSLQTLVNDLRTSGDCPPPARPGAIFHPGFHFIAARTAAAGKCHLCRTRIPG